MNNPHIVRKSSSPIAAPPEAGIHWINIVTNEEFFSVGTSSLLDWLPRPRVGTHGGLIIPKITTALRETLTLDEAELFFDEDEKAFYGGDGTTLGGQKLCFCGTVSEAVTTESGDILTTESGDTIDTE